MTLNFIGKGIIIGFSITALGSDRMED